MKADELAQYQHLLPRAAKPQPCRSFGIVSQPVRNITVSQAQAPDSQGVRNDSSTGSPSTSHRSSGYHHHSYSNGMTVPLYQGPCTNSLCPLNRNATRNPLNGSRNVQGNGEANQNPSGSNPMPHCHRQNSNQPRSGSLPADTMVTSVVLSNRDPATRQQQLASFLSTLGLANSVARNSLQAYNRDQGTSQGSSRQRYHLRDSRSSVLTHLRRGNPHMYNLPPRVQRNIVQNLSLIMRSRLEASNRQFMALTACNGNESN